RLLQLRIRIVPSFFRCVCELVHSRSRQSGEFEEAPLQTHTIVPLSRIPNDLDTSGAQAMPSLRTCIGDVRVGTLATAQRVAQQVVRYGSFGSGCRRAQGI